MMGLDYRKKSDGQPHLEDNEAYFAIYAKNDRPEPDRTAEPVRGKVIYSYQEPVSEEDFRKHTLRKNLAVQEHYRWNAFMICNGFVPATRDQILAGRAKDYSLRIHGNLTPFEGLFEFRKLHGMYPLA